ncbi:ABC transporter permease [Microbacterium sp. gxy059]|uniref:ABC transporter permease n=1 Tax=Microbacterium sp. gxy059 TaxID=2957199 RepID=UPI003D963A5E
MNPQPTALSTAQGAVLVAEREVTTRLRSKAFLITTAIFVFGILAAIIVMHFVSSGESTTSVAAQGEAAQTLEQVDGFEVTPVDGRDEAEQLVVDGEVEAAVLPDDASPTGLAVIADTEAPSVLLEVLSQSPSVELLDPDGGWSPLRYMMGLAFGVIFMTACMTFALPVATSVVEEKQTRVIEILITAIPARALLAGKVLGNTVLALAQIVLIAVAVAVGLVVTGQTDILQGLGTPLLWFALFFLAGFLLISTLYAATGAMVSRQEDIGQSTMPVMWLVLIPYMMVIVFSTNPMVMTIMSYVPFSAPVSMPIRLFFGEADWWEPVASIAISLATCLVVILLSAKIYENSLLRMGSRVKLGEALRAER